MKNLTPKEKAKELYNNFFPYVLVTDKVGNYIEIKYAKKCALICVDEMKQENDLYDKTDGYVQKRLDFLEEVKQQIELL
jgi:hypothetical protein